MKTFLALIVAVVAASTVNATEQALDRLVLSGHEYGIEQQPMLGLWHSEDWKSEGDQPMPEFEVTSSANWRGYVATFSISDDKLILLDIEAQIDGKPATGRDLLKKRLPVVARWYTGSIFVPVGEFDYDAQASQYVIEFIVDKGSVTDTRYHQSIKIPVTWNGKPRSPKSDKKGKSGKGHPCG
ncbi:MAG: hypothetical protein KatS3mg111_4385 [Pirellulaceae bacterium]|nr:MAG: hypothetical protein KatS3mg111_4167 [Pirellulaceae bacterium]GIX01053.1 MAG: hypothetical protein KatS3mg111_4385 [Pirellulaceae bacterium]